MSGQELWALALEHHVPYFIVGMLVIWFWPNIYGGWMKLREAWTTRGPRRARSSAAPSSSEIRANLQELQSRQEDVARRLTALQGQGELGSQQKEQR